MVVVSQPGRILKDGDSGRSPEVDPVADKDRGSYAHARQPVGGGEVSPDVIGLINGAGVVPEVHAVKRVADPAQRGTDRGNGFYLIRKR